MNRRDRERKLRRAQAHGPQQRQRLLTAIQQATETAKKQKKGKKGIEAAMRKLGYEPSAKNRLGWSRNPLMERQV